MKITMTATMMIIKITIMMIIILRTKMVLAKE